MLSSNPKYHETDYESKQKNLENLFLAVPLS